MKNNKMMMAILLAMVLSASVLAGCSTTDSNSSLPESSESSSSEASVPEESETTITGVVKETSDAEMVVTLEDGSELTLNVEGIENRSDVAVGDSITINYAEEGDVLVASSVEKVESEEEEGSSASSEQSTSQPAESNASQSSAPATNPSTATGNSGTTAAAANTNKSAKERAQALFAADKLDIMDWNAPATAISAALNQMFFEDADGNIIAYFTPADVNNMTSNLKAHGFYDSRDLNIGWVKAFNDYRGVKTNLINNHTLDDNMENYICYRYDANTDSFSEVLIPVDGSSAEVANPSDSPNNIGSSDSNADWNELANEMVDLANSERKKAGVPEVSIDSNLMDLAAMRAEELATSYSHTRPNGEEDQYTGKPDYEWVMCNIGRGQNTPSKVVSDWMNSSGHKRNMLYAGHDSVGAGCYQDSNGKWYWCIMFYADGGSYPDY